jgi:hypothetical protein
MSLQKLAESASNPKKQKVLRLIELFQTLDIDILDFRELTIGDAIRKLKNIRNSLSADQSPDKINSILLPLLELEYQNPFEAGPYDINNNKGLFSNENCRLSDINENLLFSNVSDLMNVKYLNPAVENWNWEEYAKGIIFGAYSRPIMSFPVQLENKTSLMVHFLIDTGAPNSEIPVNVFETLVGSSPEHLPSAFHGNVGGVRIILGICSSAGNHVDVPLLGQDFFKEAKVEIKINYVTKNIEMKRVL